MERHAFNIRFPLPLWWRLQARAKATRRTITQEILIAIEQYLDRGDGQLLTDPQEKTVAEKLV